MDFDLKSVIASVAPTLATMLGGPLAGTAVSALESAFGLNPGAGQAEITKVVQSGGMTPDIIAGVRAADQKHAEIIQQQGIDLAKLNAAHEEAMANTAAGDRDSARKREIAIKDRTPQILTYMYTVALFILIGVRLYIATQHIVIDPLSQTSIDTMVGVLLTMVIGGKEYFLGTSSTEARSNSQDTSKAPPIGKG